MDIVKLNDPDKEIFNQYVGSHPRGTFLQSWEWGDWQKSLGKNITRLIFKSQDKIVGSAQVMINPSPMGSYSYCAYGPLWNHELPSDTVDELIKTFVSYLKQEKKVMFVRLEPVVPYDLKRLGAYQAEWG